MASKSDCTCKENKMKKGMMPFQKMAKGMKKSEKSPKMSNTDRKKMMMKQKKGK